jgi:hypothetical protein
VEAFCISLCISLFASVIHAGNMPWLAMWAAVNTLRFLTLNKRHTLLDDEVRKV